MKMQIILEDIVKNYGQAKNQVRALRNLSLQIKAGDIVAIIGKSGCGKSTLLNILGGLDSPNSGQYLYEGQEISALPKRELDQFRKSNIGFVVQHFALIPDYTVYDNIALPLRYHKLKKDIIKDRVQSLLAQFGLEDKAKAYPTELSGGQSQRVAIARAVIGNPPLLLADEPTGELDSANRENIMKIFEMINNQGTTVIIVTHDFNVAAYCNSVVEMLDGAILRTDGA